MVDAWPGASFLVWKTRMRMPFPSSISQKLREGLAREEGGSRSEKNRAKQSKDMATG